MYQLNLGYVLLYLLTRRDTSFATFSQALLLLHGRYSSMFRDRPPYKRPPYTPLCFRGSVLVRNKHVLCFYCYSDLVSSVTPTQSSGTISTRGRTCSRPVPRSFSCYARLLGNDYSNMDTGLLRTFRTVNLGLITCSEN